jgi:hypothetical protein
LARGKRDCHGQSLLYSIVIALVAHWRRHVRLEPRGCAPFGNVRFRFESSGGATREHGENVGAQQGKGDDVLTGTLAAIAVDSQHALGAGRACALARPLPAESRADVRPERAIIAARKATGESPPVYERNGTPDARARCAPL